MRELVGGDGDLNLDHGERKGFQGLLGQSFRGWIKWRRF